MSSDWMIVVTTMTVYIAIVISPGPSFAIVTRLALAEGCGSAFGAVFGLATASFIYAVLTMSGLAVVLARSSELALLLKTAGGIYLIYLGVTAWKSSFRSGSHAEAPSSSSGRSGPLRSFQAGVLVNLANPKGIAFFLSLYAAAIPLSAPLWVKAVILVSGFLSEVLWYGGVAFLLSAKAVRSRLGRVLHYLERFTGAVMIGFGIKLLAAQR